jgi:hypothetical protein
MCMPDPGTESHLEDLRFARPPWLCRAGARPVLWRKPVLSGLCGRRRSMCARSVWVSALTRPHISCVNKIRVLACFTLVAALKYVVA